MDSQAAAGCRFTTVYGAIGAGRCLAGAAVRAISSALSQRTLKTGGRAVGEDDRFDPRRLPTTPRGRRCSIFHIRTARDIQRSLAATARSAPPAATAPQPGP